MTLFLLDMYYNLKTVLTLLAQRQLAGNTAWSESQQNTLQAIADQCRHQGGIGVVLARTAIGVFIYNDEAMCPGQGLRPERSELATRQLARLAPNPASDICHVTFEKPMSGTLFVRDLQGQILRTLQLREEATLDLDTYNLVNGLYLISIKDVQGRQFVSKLAVIH